MDENKNFKIKICPLQAPRVYKFELDRSWMRAMRVYVLFFLFFFFYCVQGVNSGVPHSFALIFFFFLLLKKFKRPAEYSLISSNNPSAFSLVRLWSEKSCILRHVCLSAVRTERCQKKKKNNKKKAKNKKKRASGLSVCLADLKEYVSLLLLFKICLFCNPCKHVYTKEGKRTDPRRGVVGPWSEIIHLFLS